MLADGDLKRLLAACKGTTFRDRRDLAMIRLMLASGLRVSEACGLGLADLDLTNRLVAVTDGKGGKSRVVRRMAFNSAKARRLRRNADALDAEVAPSEQSADHSGLAGAENPQGDLEGGGS